MNQLQKNQLSIALIYNTMNIPTLIPVKHEQVQKYLPKAVELTLTGKISQPPLSKEQKTIISKIYKNLNTICKLNVKQVKQLIKSQPQYQDALADLYFDKKINNYILISNNQKQEQHNKLILEEEVINHPYFVCGVQYRIEFTISNIAKKNVMKPVVLLIFKRRNGTKLSLYYNIDQFSQLRSKIAGSMRQIFGIQFRSL